MFIIRFCFNCGYLRGYEPNSKNECPVCQAKMEDTNLDWKAFGHMSKEEEDEYRKILLGDKIISHEMTLKRLEYEAKRKAEIYSASQPSNPKVTCPYCQSSNVKKIGAGGRLLSTLTFGIASGKIGKQWHCNSCRSDF